LRRPASHSKRRLAAEALAGDTRLDVVILLAAAANHLSETPQARAALQRLLMRTPTVSGVLASDPSRAKVGGRHK